MKTLQLSLIAAVILMSSCKKTPIDNSTIHGNVTYVRWSGTEYTGSNASVSLYSGTGISGVKEKTTTAASDGSYTFSGVKDGTHTVLSEGTYSTTYYYQEAGVSVIGDDNKTVNVKMQ